jgi:hypothetical protein
MPPISLAFAVSSLPDGRYRVSLSSPSGEATEDVSAPFTPQELEDFHAVFTRQREGVTRAQEAATARTFGGRLFDFLIRKNESINQLYTASLAQAGADGVRLRLAVDRAKGLDDIAWEFLRDPQRDFLALSRSTPLVRYTAQFSPRPALPVKLPLRVLVMISTPTGYEALDVEGEWQRLNEATAELQKRKLLVLERLDTATLIALQRTLRTRDYHVFHYIGHSAYDSLANQGLLVFEGEGANGRAQLVSAGSLSREIGEEGTIRLVVLNSCKSAQGTQEDAFAGIATSLVARGIPAVVAMQFEITDPAAQAFAEEFYRAIAETLPIESAVSEGRRAIANRIQNIEWATPILYMRADDGALFDTGTRDQTKPSTAPVVLPTSTVDVVARRPFPWLIAGAALVLLGSLAGVLLSRILADPVVTPTLTFAPPTVIVDATPTLPPGALPDLAVTTIRNTPRNPAPGQVFLLSIGITNLGDAPSGDFEYLWDASTRQRNADFGRIEGLPPGAARSFTIRFAYGWWGTYDSVVNVDDLNAVRERDERVNNRRDQTITVDANAPFNVDFSLLPTIQLSEPGMLASTDEFVPWNMVFGVAAETRSDCQATPIVFIALPEDDMAIHAEPDGVPDDCPLLPLSIGLRQPVGSAQVEVVPLQDGSGTLILYADLDGERELMRFTGALVAGQPTVLGEPIDLAQGIRRIDIAGGDQVLALTRLTLLPP